MHALFSEADMQTLNNMLYTVHLMSMHALKALWLLAGKCLTCAARVQVLLPAEGGAEPGRGAAAPGTRPTVPGAQPRPPAGAHQGPARQLLPRAGHVSTAAQLHSSAPCCWRSKRRAAPATDAIFKSH